MARKIDEDPNSWEAKERAERRALVKWITLGVIVLIAIGLFFGSFRMIGAGERGVVLTWGKASPEAREPGWNWKLPIAQQIVKMSVQTQKYEASASSASSDLQVVSTKVAVNYHLTPETVPELYKEIGLGYQDRIIQPLVQEAVKAATAKYQAEQLITNRAEVKNLIQTSLQERLIARGIIVEEVSITDFDFSASFNEAIEAKVTAEQLKLKAERDLERVLVEKDQKIAAAQAEAESLRLQKTEITEDLLRLRQIEVQKAAIDKWDGKMPMYMMGDSVPFISLSTK